MNNCSEDSVGGCPADLLNADWTFNDSYSITVEGRTFTLMYEEMVEILAAIRDTPVQGNEYFEDARTKACHILQEHIILTNY